MQYSIRYRRNVDGVIKGDANIKSYNEEPFGDLTEETFDSIRNLKIKLRLLCLGPEVSSGFELPDSPIFKFGIVGGVEVLKNGKPIAIVDETWDKGQIDRLELG